MSRTALISVSDLHLTTHYIRRPKNVSLVTRMWKRMVGKDEEMVEDVNPLDDFPKEHEEMFDRLLKKLAVYFASYERVILLLNGDVFDLIFSHIVHEEGAVQNMQKIIVSNPIFFTALGDWLREPRHEIVITTGNHDVELNWSGVQAVVRQAIEDAAYGMEVECARLHFVDYTDSYIFQVGPVLFTHGNEADVLNMTSSPLIVTKSRLGLPLDAPEMRIPLGSTATVEIVYPVKMRHAAIGRELDVRRIVKYFALHDLTTGLYMEWRFWVFLAWYFVDAFRKGSVLQFLRRIGHISMLPFVKDSSDIAFARKLMRTHDVKLVVMGHTHKAGIHTLEEGMYFNSGTWSALTRYKTPEIQLKWRKLRTLEYVFRLFVHYIRSRERFIVGVLFTVFYAYVLFRLGFWWGVGYLVVSFLMFLGSLIATKPYIERWVRPTFVMATFEDEKEEQTLQAGLYMCDEGSEQGFRQYLG
jgi:hypothetical protein